MKTKFVQKISLESTDGKVGIWWTEDYTEIYNDIVSHQGEDVASKYFADGVFEDNHPSAVGPLESLAQGDMCPGPDFFSTWDPENGLRHRKFVVRRETIVDEEGTDDES